MDKLEKWFNDNNVPTQIKNEFYEFINKIKHNLIDIDCGRGLRLEFKGDLFIIIDEFQLLQKQIIGLKELIPMLIDEINLKIISIVFGGCNYIYCAFLHDRNYLLAFKEYLINIPQQTKKDLYAILKRLKNVDGRFSTNSFDTIICDIKENNDMKIQLQFNLRKDFDFKIMRAKQICIALENCEMIKKLS